MDSVINFFGAQSSPIIQALYAGLFTWILTAIGAALVFMFKSTNRKTLDMCLGFTGGVMIAASFWSLLSPAITAVKSQGKPCVYQPLKEGYRAWAAGFALPKTTKGKKADAVYDFVNWYLSGWVGAYLNRQGYYGDKRKRIRKNASSY